MPVINIRESSHAVIRQRRQKHKIILLACFLFIFSCTLFLFIFVDFPLNIKRGQNTEKKLVPSDYSHKTNTASGRNKPSTELRNFTAQQFNKLVLSMKYPNTQLFPELPQITGNKLADDEIRNIAESRGYRPTSIPVSPIVKLDDPLLENDDLLQPLAANAWLDLRQAAIRDNIPLTLTSAYRSPEYQRQLFMSRLNAMGVSASQIAEGVGNESVNTILSTVAIPGYSRHHTGYVIDLWCDDGSKTFQSSTCFDWISRDNYRNAKERGWVPSYPDGVNAQGPEPEPWEYVWVSEVLLRK